MNEIRAASRTFIYFAQKSEFIDMIKFRILEYFLQCTLSYGLDMGTFHSFG